MLVIVLKLLLTPGVIDATLFFIFYFKKRCFRASFVLFKADLSRADLATRQLIPSTATHTHTPVLKPDARSYIRFSCLGRSTSASSDVRKEPGVCASTSGSVEPGASDV